MTLLDYIILGLAFIWIEDILVKIHNQLEELNRKVSRK